MEAQLTTAAGTPEDMESASEFEELYRNMLPTVYRFASARLGPEEGEDVTSEVFHAAAVAFTDGRADIVTPAWIMTVTRNKVIDRWRTAARRNAIALRFRPRKADLASFPADWTEDPRREHVLAALDAVSTDDRALLVLHYLDGMSAPDLAAELDITVSAIESRLARARRRFRSHYKPTMNGGLS